MSNFCPRRIPLFNLVVIGNNVKNFPANKNINNSNKNISNNKNFTNNNKNISQINYPNLKGRAISISVKFPSIIKFSIKFGNTKFPYYIEIKFNGIINFKFPYYIKFPSIIKFSIKFPYYIVIVKFPYYIKFIRINYIKINNVIGVRQLQEANCLTNHQHCSCQGGTQKFLSLDKISRIKFKKKNAEG